MAYAADLLEPDTRLLIRVAHTCLGASHPCSNTSVKLKFFHQWLRTFREFRLQQPHNILQLAVKSITTCGTRNDYLHLVSLGTLCQRENSWHSWQRFGMGPPCRTRAAGSIPQSWSKPCHWWERRFQGRFQVVPNCNQRGGKNTKVWRVFDNVPRTWFFHKGIQLWAKPSVPPRVYLPDHNSWPNNIKIFRADHIPDTRAPAFQRMWHQGLFSGARIAHRWAVPACRQGQLQVKPAKVPDCPIVFFGINYGMWSNMYIVCTLAIHLYSGTYWCSIYNIYTRILSSMCDLHICIACTHIVIRVLLFLVFLYPCGFVCFGCVPVFLWRFSLCFGSELPHF